MSDSMPGNEDLVQKLEQLREGTLAPVEVPGLLLDIGKAQLLEAQPDIETELTNPDPYVRSIALQVLTLDFGLERHVTIARHFLQADPSSETRAAGASALGRLKRDTEDRDTLALLASTVRNDQETKGVRRDAYAAMLSIIHFKPRQQLAFVSRSFDPTQDVDWALVDAYLPEHGKDEQHGGS